MADQIQNLFAKGIIVQDEAGNVSVVQHQQERDPEEMDDEEHSSLAEKIGLSKRRQA